MDHLPLTRPEPFTEFPAAAGLETLFPELAPAGLRQFEVVATIAGGESPSMQIVIAEANVETAFAMAWSACRGLGEFEVRVRPLPPAG